MYQVIKRDGHAAEFNISRISSAIMKAFDATGIPYNSDVIDLLSLQVTADYAGKIRDDRIGVETIQDSVEAVLQRAGQNIQPGLATNALAGLAQRVLVNVDQVFVGDNF